MRFLFSLLLFSSLAHAQNSRVIPVLSEAAQLVLDQKFSPLLRPELRAVHALLVPMKTADLKRIARLKNRPLPPPDRFDLWIRKANPKLGFKYALHAHRLDIVDPSDDWTKDDVYAYFFVTTGVIPVGSVSSIYKGVGKGDGFIFTPNDRKIFPLGGPNSQAIENHLIVDYGIVESDGDDIRKLQRLSAIIVDVAVAVYATQEPTQAARLADLRREVKVLAEALLSMNQDDRLVVSSMGMTLDEIEKRLGSSTYVELKRRHHKDSFFDSWDYRLSFRLLRN